jgi:hypothetical protein
MEASMTKTDRGKTSKLRPGTVVERRVFTTVDGVEAAVPDTQLLTHLQFRRFAGCPVCNLHLRSVARREPEITAAGVREVVFFHAPSRELRPYVADLPLAVIGDPEKLTYREFGVEAAPRALLDPRVWPTVVRSVAVSLGEVLRARKPMPPSRSPHGGRVGLPADFLIAPDGTVLAAKYGAHAGDQWSVEELLRLAARAGHPGFTRLPEPSAPDAPHIK